MQNFGNHYSTFLYCNASLNFSNRVSACVNIVHNTSSVICNLYSCTNLATMVQHSGLHAHWGGNRAQFMIVTCGSLFLGWKWHKILIYTCIMALCNSSKDFQFLGSQHCTTPSISTMIEPTLHESPFTTSWISMNLWKVT